MLLGGERVYPVAGGAYMQPTLIATDDASLAIVQEEVFGPVLVIQTAEDVAGRTAARERGPATGSRPRSGRQT